MRPTSTNGKICYLEIPAADVSRSAGFYADVFGWTMRKRGDGATAFDDATGQVSGAFVLGKQASPLPGLLIYIMVDSVAAACALVEAHGGAIVQLLGVDAPEPDQPFGHQAGDSVARLLGQHPLVRLTRRGLDLYGRTLATVWLPEASGPALALDSLLVARGWAWAWDPKRRVADRAAQQAAAVAGRRGLWKCGAVGVLAPRQWRKFNYQNKRRYGVGCTW